MSVLRVDTSTSSLPAESLSCVFQPRVRRRVQLLLLGGSEPLPAAAGAEAGVVSEPEGLLPPGWGLQPQHGQGLCSTVSGGLSERDSQADGHTRSHHHQQRLSQQARGRSSTTPTAFTSKQEAEPSETNLDILSAWTSHVIQAGAGADADSRRRRTSAPTGGAVGLLVLLAPDCGQSFMYHLRLL